MTASSAQLKTHTERMAMGPRCGHVCREHCLWLLGIWEEGPQVFQLSLEPDVFYLLSHSVTNLERNSLEPAMGVCPRDSSTWAVEARGSEVQDHPSEAEAA